MRHEPVTQRLSSSQGGHSVIKNMGGWLDDLGSGILVGKVYFGVLEKY